MPSSHFINDKLRNLGTEKRRLTRRLEELEATPYEPIDAAAVLRDGKAALRQDRQSADRA